MVSLVVLAFAALLFTGAGCSGQSSDSMTDTKTGTSPSSITPEQTYTFDDVALHATADDCWMAIDGLVYDVTDAVVGHPGGQAMLAGCGKDSTRLFATKGRGESGPPHSSQAEASLENHLIGTLE